MEVRGNQNLVGQPNDLRSKYGYYPKPSKSFLIVKQHCKEYAAERIFAGSNINITTEGARHLGAVLGDFNFRKEYLRNKIQS